MFSSIVKIFKYILYIILTIPRDIKGLRMIRKVKGKIKHYEDLGYSVTDIFQVWAKKQPTKACFIFEDTVWTFQDVEVYARKMASLFSQRFGLKKGDCVALLMENKPEYVAIWYGLSKLGVITACINTNQKMKTLVHSIQVSKAKFLIYDEDLEQSELS
jgi:solute carrier family 27 fatty acid transporter 1/4